MVLFYQVPCRFEIFINLFAFLYIKANSKEICQEISFPSQLFQKNADVTIFVEIPEKNVWLLSVFQWPDSNTPYKDLQVLTLRKNLCI